jgi:hypothetical protein
MTTLKYSIIGWCALKDTDLNCSKTSLIQINWERTLVQISERPNYRSATENMFREVVKWDFTCLFRQHNFILKLRLHIIE